MAAFDNLSNPSEYLAYWGKTYRNELLSNILPFWMKYGLDKENGGYFTCVDRDGTLMDSTKSVWFQGRFAFILAYAYNHIEKNEEWLRACKNGIDFIEKHCFDTDVNAVTYSPRLSRRSLWLTMHWHQATKAMLRRP